MNLTLHNSKNTYDSQKPILDLESASKNLVIKIIINNVKKSIHGIN